jgi:hypothetical protein
MHTDLSPSLTTPIVTSRPFSYAPLGEYRKHLSFRHRMTSQRGATDATMRHRTRPTAEARTTAKNISLVVLLRTLQYPFLIVSAMLVPRFMGPEATGSSRSCSHSSSSQSRSLIWVSATSSVGSFHSCRSRATSPGSGPSVHSCSVSSWLSM